MTLLLPPDCATDRLCLNDVMGMHGGVGPNFNISPKPHHHCNVNFLVDKSILITNYRIDSSHHGEGGPIQALYRPEVSSRSEVSKDTV